ncbi:MAG: purine-binding chemotaxis protein CheW [Verrucomicrobiales bacterium]|nr:purine-binding chemotaxis protein CheW [Verrucomicrobiales bacterium]
MNTGSNSDTRTAAEPGRYLTFTLGRESYGVPVLSVREIIRVCPITPVPRVPQYIRGVINLRGKVIPVLDLRAKFGMSEGGYGERACIVLLQVGVPPVPVTQIGVMVDGVEEVVALSAAELGAVPDFGGSLDTRFLMGLATVRGAVKTLLNLNAILAEEGTVSIPVVSPPAP